VRITFMKVGAESNGRVIPKASGGREFADFLDGRGDYRCSIFGVREFQAHSAADKAAFQHGATPRRSGDINLNWLRTVLGMSGDECRTIIQQDRGVAVMLGLNLEDGFGRKIFQENAALNLRLDNTPVDLVAEVGMGHEMRHLGHEEAPTLGTVYPWWPLERGLPRSQATIRWCQRGKAKTSSVQSRVQWVHFVFTVLLRHGSGRFFPPGQDANWVLVMLAGAYSAEAERKGAVPENLKSGRRASGPAMGADNMPTPYAAMACSGSRRGRVSTTTARARGWSPPREIFACLRVGRKSYNLTNWLIKI
jgi:hypothetical protein